MSTLQYLPGAERVNITIVKGRDLKLEEFDKGNTPYAYTFSLLIVSMGEFLDIKL